MQKKLSDPDDIQEFLEDSPPTSEWNHIGDQESEGSDWFGGDDYIEEEWEARRHLNQERQGRQRTQCANFQLRVIDIID